MLGDVESEEWRWRVTDDFPLWTVYSNPRDYPGKFVVRRSLVSSGGILPDREPLAVADTLEAARAVVPAWLTVIPRSPEDDPVIVEVWL